MSTYIQELKKQEALRLKFMQKEGGTYITALDFWTENLFERIMNMFIWDVDSEILPKEIEQRLIINGSCAIVDFLCDEVKELTAFYNSFHGVTKYYDEKKFCTVTCPIYSGEVEIGVDCAVIDNTKLRNPLMPVVEHYAHMLAHTEVTLVNTLINARDGGGVPAATSEKQKQSIIDYQTKLYNGEYGCITDFGALGVQYAGSDRHTTQNIVDIMEVRQKLLKNFYSDIGVKAAFDKRSNAVTSEVEADSAMLLFNVSDMLETRKKGCRAVNDLFGTSWDVRLNPEIINSAERRTEDESTDN